MTKKRRPTQNDVIDRALDAATLFVALARTLDLECLSAAHLDGAPCLRCSRVRDNIVRALEAAYEAGQRSVPFFGEGAR